MLFDGVGNICDCPVGRRHQESPYHQLEDSRRHHIHPASNPDVNVGGGGNSGLARSVHHASHLRVERLALLEPWPALHQLPASQDSILLLLTLHRPHVLHLCLRHLVPAKQHPDPDYSRLFLPCAQK